MTRAVLALDQGSHASRACVFDEGGELRASATVPVGTRHPAGECVEQDALEIVASLRTAIRQCRDATQGLVMEAAGLATQRSSIACFERESLAPLCAVLSWQDRRNAAWLAQFAPQAARVRELTGLPLSPHYGASKLRWCLDRIPQVQQAARQQRLCAAPLAAYLAAALGGCRPSVDPANASRTLLFDSTLLGWSDELLQLFGIERGMLPDCVDTRADYGALPFGATSLPLVASTGDQSAVPFAFGAADAGTAYVNLGTGAFIQRPLTARPATTAPLLGSVLSAAAGHAIYSLEGTVNGAGSAVSWFAGETGSDPAAMWAALEQLPDAAPLPIFMNGVGGLGSPWWRDMPVNFIGAGSEIERFAAVIESVAFMIAENFELMVAAGGTLSRLVVTGGMSRSDWLCRRLAATLGVTVERMDAEATARGVAALAAPTIAAGWPAPASQHFEPRRDAQLASRRQQFRERIAG